MKTRLGGWCLSVVQHPTDVKICRQVQYYLTEANGICSLVKDDKTVFGGYEIFGSDSNSTGSILETYFRFTLCDSSEYFHIVHGCHMRFGIDCLLIIVLKWTAAGTTTVGSAFSLRGYPLCFDRGLPRACEWFILVHVILGCVCCHDRNFVRL